ncbi:hypothetical protein [Streptomyces sp. NBC_00370]|uniref:hypothetical protein n=1 Tax=Streptomyces sp. NBC_00370 TaxID=2975728 RepID=UPI002E2701D9
MPRGRHRHSPPLHKLLPPISVAGAAVVCAAGAWLFADPVVLRTCAALAAAAAATGAVFMRRWDEDAGHRVADLTRARESDQWQTEERIAELEADIDESREIRVKLDGRLRAKRVELARLRGEHAALLRRYATAETERATALEGRRQLAIEAAAEPKALLPAGDAATPSAYLMARRAMESLPRKHAEQQVRRTVEAALNREKRETTEQRAETAEQRVEQRAEAKEPQGKHAAAAGGEQHSRTSSALPATRVPTASAIVPYSPQRGPVRLPGGGFDFFGTQIAGTTHNTAAAPAEQHGEDDKGADAEADSGDKDTESGQDGPASAAELADVEGEDLADVVGEEAVAEQRTTNERTVGQVIDLTEHDETEQLELGRLRSKTG